MQTIQETLSFINHQYIRFWEIIAITIIEEDNPGPYKLAGVDIDTAADFISDITSEVGSTRRPGANTQIGGFGGLFDLAKAGYKDPILVASTDGVGTKLRIAIDIEQYSTIGIDLVAMCVNDLIVQGAEPLFFLDYYATAKLDRVSAHQVISGITAGCRESKCALIGGETAEMPGMYALGDFDLAGFAVGAVERNKVLTGETIRPGDAVIGIRSSGVHSNGFSLVRKIIEDTNLTYHDPCPFSPGSIGEELLRPTKIYVNSCLSLHRAGIAKGFAHITGGGLKENIPRILPPNTKVLLNAERWSVPEVFTWIFNTGRVPSSEMIRTFNCGIGMILIVDEANIGAALSILDACGETAWVIGDVLSSEDETDLVQIEALDTLWAD